MISNRPYRFDIFLVIYRIATLCLQIRGMHLTIHELKKKWSLHHSVILTYKFKPKVLTKMTGMIQIWKYMDYADFSSYTFIIAIQIFTNIKTTIYSMVFRYLP